MLSKGRSMKERGNKLSFILSSFIATLVTIPILGYLLVFIIAKQITKKHKRSVHIALDTSTLLFILSVHYLILVIWNKSFFPYILLLIISIAIVFVIIHWKVKQEINILQVFRGFWRFNFLLFFTAYAVLFLYGLIFRVSSLISMP